MCIRDRGYDDKSNESNDFLLLIQKKEFKDLIALELYEYYFWNERHEFDLQLLKEIVDSVCLSLIHISFHSGLLLQFPDSPAHENIFLPKLHPCI